MGARGIRIGSLDELQAAGRLVGKVDGRPVLVVCAGDQIHAIDDRCPHLGFPLHQGTVDDGLVTCHWHHARFDLSSGCTLDPWADDAEGYDVEVAGDDVVVSARPVGDRVGHLLARLRQGLEDGLTLVTAKAALGLLESGVPAADVVREGMEFGARHRAAGWGSGLTVLVAMANVAPHLRDDDRGLALVHGLAFVARDVAGQPPRFAQPPLEGSRAPAERLADWYRRFVDSRNGDGAERALATLLARRDLATAETAMFAALTDHVFVDEGHTLDFTNKAFEALDLLARAPATARGADRHRPEDRDRPDDRASRPHADVSGDHDRLTCDAELLLPTLVGQTAAAERAEEALEWRHPVDLAGLARSACDRLPAVLDAGRAGRAAGRAFGDGELGELGWRFHGDDPAAVLDALLDALGTGATLEQAARAVAFAAGLRLTRFHTQNDHGDWNQVHHAFTTANAVHQAIIRRPTPELARGLVHGVLRVHLDRFLNIPAARLPGRQTGDLAALEPCWERQGGVDEAGAVAYGFLSGGGDPAELVAALGRALLAEDAGFHWYQVFEAAVRQHRAWPPGSEQSRLLLAGLARFLAAHTPTRRELPRVVQIARRLRRGDALYEATGEV